MKARMRADADGNLSELLLNDQSFDGPDRWRQLHNHVAALAGDGSLVDSAEIEFDCDFGLKYEHVIDAITAVSGTVTPDGRVIKLVEKIKFAPPRPE
jgi:biopolymer transport protein ExbD